jgi:hypothetical protein
MVTMARQRGSQSGSSGRLSYQPGRDDGLIPNTIVFVRTQLAAWRDDPNRPKESSEKRLNPSLCAFLDRRARSECPMVQFLHEDPQRGTSTVDIGIHGTGEITLIEAGSYTSYEPFMVIEAKRLPTPGKEREREYVTGSNKTSGGATGGIQRFKLGRHGSKVETAIIVGYVQKKSVHHWHETINRWITDLTGETSSDGCVWIESDILEPLDFNDEQGTSTTMSRHQRSDDCRSSSIIIHHLWVVMSSAKRSAR